MLNRIPSTLPPRVLFLVFLVFPFFAHSSSNYRIPLDENLALFLPGNSIQQQSARAFAEQELQTFFALLEKERIQKKSTTKAIRIVNNQVHTIYFKQYDATASFSDLFKTGHYNESTCGALYALIFEQYSLPYTLIFQENAVVFWADPEENPQELSAFARPENSTDFSSFVTDYANLLTALSLDQNRHNSSSAEEMYYEHFFNKNQHLSTRELASYLCFQQVLKNYDIKAFEEALHWLDSANQLSEQALYQVFEKSIWVQQASSEEPSALTILWQLWKDNPAECWSNELINRFSFLCSNYNDPTNGDGRIDSLHKVFDTNFNGHTALQEKLRVAYFLEQARFFSEQNRAARVMDFMDSLYHIRPNEEEVHTILAGILVWSLRSERRFEQGLERIKYYANRYSFLSQNSHFQDQHLFYLSEKIRYYLDREDFTQGFAFFNKFKTLVELHPDAPRLVNWVSTSYLALSNYFIRKGDYHTALVYLKEANDITPEDPYLEHRIDLIENYYLR